MRACLAPLARVVLPAPVPLRAGKLADHPCIWCAHRHSKPSLSGARDAGASRDRPGSSSHGKRGAPQELGTPAPKKEKKGGGDRSRGESREEECGAPDLATQVRGLQREVAVLLRGRGAAAAAHTRAQTDLEAEAAALRGRLARGKARRDKLRGVHTACKQGLQERAAALEAELRGAREQVARLQARMEAGGGGAPEGTPEQPDAVAMLRVISMARKSAATRALLLDALRGQ